MAITMTPEDEARAKSLSEQWKQQQAAGASQSDLNDIHQANEAIKSKYGFSGGADGTQYVPLANTQATATTPTSNSNSYESYINQIYDEQAKQQKAALEAEYNKNVAKLNATAEQIPDTYNAAKNQTASTYAQNQQAFNERAAASGINSGTGSQAALAMGNVMQGNMSNLDKAQANAISDINAQRAELETNYNTAINQALATNNLEKAQALYQEKTRADNLLLQQQQYQDSLNWQNRQYNDTLVSNNAQALASIGDFSGFKLPPYNWTDEQVAQAESQFKQEKAKAYSYSGGGYTSDNNNNNQNVKIFGVDANATYSDLKSQGYPDWQILQSAQTDYKNGDMTEQEYKAIVNAVQINAASQRRNS